MAERGQKSRLIFGGITADVALYKASGPATDAKHETRRVPVHAPPLTEEQRETAGDAEEASPALHYAEPGDLSGFGLRADVTASGDGVAVSLGVAEDDDPLGGPGDPEPPPPRPGPHAMAGAIVAAEDRDARERMAEPETRVEQGVWVGAEGEEPTWVDLTEALAAIDERTKVEGLEVIAAVALASLPRMQVRDALWIAPQRTEGGKVLRLLWEGLHHRRRGAVVRYTKRTLQALGVVIPRGSDKHPALALVELEWEQNMRPAPPRATGPLTNAEVTRREVDAARALVESFEQPAGVVRQLRDERIAKRAELLTAAREGRLEDYVPPPEVERAEPVDDLASAMYAAATSARQ